MKKNLFIVLIAVACCSAFAQHGNNWAFGYRKGLSFNTGEPQLIKTAIESDTTKINDSVAYGHGTCSYSDCKGRLLIYGHSKQLWNKENRPMKNGNFNHIGNDSVYFNLGHYQPVLIPRPGSDRFLYFFYCARKFNMTPKSKPAWLYAVIDLLGDGGRGEVITKDKVLDTSGYTYSTQHYWLNADNAIALHRNKRDLWFIIGADSATARSYRITDTGIIKLPVVSNNIYRNWKPFDYNYTSTYINHWWYGNNFQMTHDGKNMISSGIDSNITKLGPALMYDFDAQTGKLSNPITLLKFGNLMKPDQPNKTYFVNYYDVEVAPNDTIIYFLSRLSYPNERYVKCQLLQFNRFTKQISSIYVVRNEDINEIELGPDGKIYATQWSLFPEIRAPEISLMQIENPNAWGVDANYKEILKDYGIFSLGLPSLFPYYNKLYHTGNTQYKNRCVDTAVFNVQVDENFRDLTVYFGDGDSLHYNAPLKSSYTIKHKYKPGRYFFKLKAGNPLCDSSYSVSGDSLEIVAVPEYYRQQRTVTPGCGLSQLNIRDSFNLTTKAVYQWGNNNDTIKLNGQPTSAINQQQYTKGTKTYWQLTLSNNECPNYKTIKDSATLQYLTLPQIKYVVNTKGAGDSVVMKNNKKHFKGCAPLNLTYKDTTNALKGGTLQLPTIYYVYKAGHSPKQITLAAAKETMAVIRDTTVNGCTSSDTFYLTAYETPVVKLRIDSSSLCLIENKVLVSNASESGLQYKVFWGDGDSAAIDSGKQLQHKYALSKTYTLQLKTKNNEGCSAESDTSITVYPMPNAKFNVNQKEQCLKGNKFIVNSTDTLTAFHQWQQGNNFNTASSGTYRFTTSGTYAIKHISVTANNCRDTATDSLHVWPTPVAAMQVNDSSQCLQSHRVVSTLNTTFTSIIQHTLLWGDGQQSSLQGNDTLSHQYTTSGSYSLRLIAASPKGCADTVSHKMKISPSPKLQLRANGFCFGDSTFIAVTNPTSTKAATYQWWINSQPQNIPDSMFFLLFTTLGQKSIAVKGITSEGCTDSAHLAINILEKPIADFTFANLTNGNDLKYYFLNQSQHSTAWYWTFGTTDTALQKNPYHYFAQPGDVKVRLIATNQNICFDTTEKIIPVFNELDFYFPTGVSADGNGLNDGFGLHPSQLQYAAEYHIEIFNRWGGKEFETTDMNKLWYPESKMNTVYIYIAQVRDVFNILHEYKGIVEVIR